MWHSTGANNPFLSRYVGPDDGNLGVNKYNNHWNQPKPDGRSVCVHAFIGYLKDKVGIATYQTLPWDHVGWHSGSGKNGSANTQGYIGFEICEDGLNDRNYFNKVYKEAIELSVYLCRKYGLTEKDVIDHSEGYRKGIASNHGDITHWLKKFGLTMDNVRADIKKELEKKEAIEVEDKNKPDKWAEDAWNYCKEKGLLDGTRPKDPITRQEFAIVLQRLTKEGGSK